MSKNKITASILCIITLIVVIWITVRGRTHPNIIDQKVPEISIVKDTTLNPIIKKNSETPAYIKIESNRIGDIDLLKLNDIKTVQNELIKMVGENNINKITIEEEDGYFDAFKIYPDTSYEILAVIKYGFISFYFFDSVNAKANISYKDIKLGDSVEKVELLNEQSFIIRGYEVDNQGEVISWNNGKMDNNIVLGFGLMNKWSEYSNGNEIVGYKEIYSNNKIFRDLNPYVESIIIHWKLNFN